MSGEGQPQLAIAEAKDLKLAIVAGQWHATISEALIAGAQRVAQEAQIKDVTLVRVAGAIELPVVAQALARTHDAVVALGVVIRGGTPHFEYVAGECTKGIAQVSLASGLPIAFGVLTVDTIEQAIERAGTKAGNKGAEAALSALEMVSLLGRL